MEKKAKTEYPIHEHLANRWSPRSFDVSKNITQEDINSLFEAARWAPSAFNVQPWSFIYGKRNNQTFNKIVDVLVPFNQLWAPKSSVLILVCGNEKLADGNNNPTYTYDCGNAVANLTLEATSRGLYVHQMSGFDVNKAKTQFNLPENIIPLAILAVGYIDAPENLHENLVNMEMAPRERKPFQEFVSE